MMQILPGGHCMFCHKDYKEMGDQHPCAEENMKKGIMPTACRPNCPKKYNHGNTIEGKLDYIIDMLEKLGGES